METLNEPLSTPQVIAALGDILSRLETVPYHIKVFRSSRPITEQLSGGPARLQFQLSCRSSTAELLDSLGSLVNNSAFTLLNADFQRQGMQQSPETKQVREMLAWPKRMSISSWPQWQARALSLSAAEEKSTPVSSNQALREGKLLRTDLPFQETESGLDLGKFSPSRESY